MMGMPDYQAAKRAGIHETQVSRYKRDPWIAAQMQELTIGRINKARVTREKVEDIVLEAIDIARIKAEPGDMIRGASELSRMNGYYAPEQKQISLEGHIEIQQLEAMSDTQLLEILDEEPDAIEAEFERISDTG